MTSRDKPGEFTSWCAKRITRAEKGPAQLFLDRLYQACGQLLAFNQKIAAKIATGELVAAPWRARQLSRGQAMDDGGLWPIGPVGRAKSR